MFAPSAPLTRTISIMQYISMPPFVADPMSDLPHVIQLSELTRFVEELRSTEASFHPSQSDSITDEFLRTVNHVHEIYSASDMDVFFRAVYKFFKRQVHESEPLPEGLQRLGKTYSKVSQTRALLNCMSRLQDAQCVYNKAQETYYQKVQALLREEIHARDAAYQKAFSSMRASSRDLGMFTKLAGVAAEACKLQCVFLTVVFVRLIQLFFSGLGPGAWRILERGLRHQPSVGG